MVSLMQGKTEEIIWQKMEKETDCRVEWGSELVTYTQDDQGVVATIKNNKTGQEYTIAGKYIVGADGSHSKVRKSTPEWTYEGVAVNIRFLIADITMDGECLEEFSRKMNAFSTGSSKFTLIYRWRGII
jgi:2-polyprenyl-6-methoxyphenol hydroxylase-like FAD-dependent oxidoreductase